MTKRSVPDDQPGAVPIGRVRLHSLAPAAASESTVATDERWRPYLEQTALAPHDGQVRGLFFCDILRLAPTLQTGRRRYRAFGSYPLREYMRLLLDGAREVHPTLAPAEALRRLGLGVYDAFASSLIGAAVLGVTRDEPARVLELTTKAYALTMNPGSVEVPFRSESYAVAQLREVWPFPECFHLGIWQGAYKALGMRVSIDVVPVARAAVDLHVQWDPLTTRDAPAAGGE